MPGFFSDAFARLKERLKPSEKPPENAPEPSEAPAPDRSASQGATLPELPSIPEEEPDAD